MQQQQTHVHHNIQGSSDTCGPTACKKAAGGCPHRETQTCGPTTCIEAACGCPHAPVNPYMRTYNLQGPLTLDIRTNNLQGTLTRGIRTNSLQISRVWLPTRPQVSKFAGPATASVLAARFHSKHTFSASIAATEYLRGLPPGHTAASNI